MALILPSFIDQRPFLGPRSVVEGGVGVVTMRASLGVLDIFGTVEKVVCGVKRRFEQVIYRSPRWARELF